MLRTGRIKGSHHLDRVKELDGLRALCILAVVMVHASYTFDVSSSSLSTFQNVLVKGWVSFYFMFVLSGFLIGTILLREIRLTGRIDVKRFWIRRILRTWPLYYLALVLHLIFFSPTHIRPSLTAYILFVQNVTTPKHSYMNFFSQSWGLAVEEHFYLFFPLLLLCSRKNALPALLAVLIIAGIVFRYQTGAPLRGTHTLAKIDVIIWGVVLAYVNENYRWLLAKVYKYPNMWFIFGCGLLLTPPFSLPSECFQCSVWLPCVFGIGSALIIAASLSGKLWLAPLISAPPLLTMARYSYATFLFHSITLRVTRLLATHLRLEGWQHAFFIIGVGLSLTIALARTLHLLLESRLLRFRESKFPRQTKGDEAKSKGS